MSEILGAPEVILLAAPAIILAAGIVAVVGLIARSVYRRVTRHK